MNCKLTPGTDRTVSGDCRAHLADGTQCLYRMNVAFDQPLDWN